MNWSLKRPALNLTEDWCNFTALNTKLRFFTKNMHGMETCVVCDSHVRCSLARYWKKTIRMTDWEFGYSAVLSGSRAVRAQRYVSACGTCAMFKHKYWREVLRGKIVCTRSWIISEYQTGKAPPLSSPLRPSPIPIPSHPIPSHPLRRPCAPCWESSTFYGQTRGVVTFKQNEP